MGGCFSAAFVAAIHGSHGLWSHYFSSNGVFDEALLSLAVIKLRQEIGDSHA